MSPDERKENLNVMRQIFKYDLADLQRRRDYAGWVEARKDLKKRQAKDPWFELNKQMKDAVQMDETEEIDRLKVLLQKVGGPPPGVKQTGKYAVISEIYDVGMSITRAENINKYEQMKKNSQRWKQMMSERMANEEAEEEEWRNNPYKEEEEARKRRDKTMRKLYGSIEERRKKAEEKAKEVKRKMEQGDGESALDRAWKAVKRDAASIRALSAASEDSGSSSAAARQTDDNGRPRAPGDSDVMRGEITTEVLDYSETITGYVKVAVTSDYNEEQSDPPMRKHCFQYTIKITNLSSVDTIQLLSRRFEIQTVGARQKDVVQGEGVTGRQPVLKPGETFEYTSSAPLSVRPIGTTIIAARMKGTYSYVTVDPATGQAMQSVDNAKEAELGTFHFVFPPSQRVTPVSYTDDDEDEDDDDDDSPSTSSSSSATARQAVKPPTSTPAATATPSATPATTPAPTLPGDDDIKTGDVKPPYSDSSTSTTHSVAVSATSQYRPERSDTALNKHCFAYNIRITNLSSNRIQLLSRRFEIQTVGSATKDVVQGPGVTGRQPILKPGESFEYTSTAPLSVKPMSTTPVLARMKGVYGFVELKGETDEKAGDEKEAELGTFHFVLPQMA